MVEAGISFIMNGPMRCSLSRDGVGAAGSSVKKRWVTSK